MKRRDPIAFGAAAIATTRSMASVDGSDTGHAGVGEVGLERHGDDLVLDAQADVAASREIAWAVLIDYDHLARFIPDMTKSQAVDRHDAVVHVRQEGHTGFVPVQRDFWLLLEVRETPQTRIDMKRVDGTFTRFEASYAIQDAPRGGVHIVYHASFDPAMPVPDWLGLGYVRGTARERFEAVIKEMQRRAREAKR